jgi:glycolate oxidase FAD binding subunit
MTAPLDALAKACDTRPGEPEDGVQGVVPSYVAAPATVAEASEVMRTAAEHGLAIVPRGAGTKLHWGVPPDRCDLVIDTRRLGRVIEHTAGDLVVRAEAGLPLEDLQDVLAGTDQQLALDGLLPGATVGGVLATATAGPRRLLYGSARDLIIGITVIRADGVTAHAGGKVVKNVAGYDLGKLFTGSRGTLGLIAEAAFRLHPLPRARAYVTATAADAGRAHEIVQALLHSSLVPAAIEVDGPGPITVAVLLEGVPEGVTSRAEAARDLIGGEIGADPPRWWGRLPEGDVLAEVHARPTALEPLFADLGTAAAGADGDRLPGKARIRGSAGRGVWHVALPVDGAGEIVSRLRRHGGAVVLNAPETVRLDRWGPLPALPLMRRVKDQFDPGHRLSPGRFAGGI